MHAPPDDSSTSALRDDRALSLTRDAFVDTARAHTPRHGAARLAIPVGVRLLADQLTPVLAYRRLVAPDERTAPSFLFESVEAGERQGRYSILGADPDAEFIADQHTVTRRTRRPPRLHHAADIQRDTDDADDITEHVSDPLATLRDATADIELVTPPESQRTHDLPDAFLGGWVGFAGYDAVRYAEPNKLPFAAAPPDDRRLPDLHFAFYTTVVVFDHATKLVHVVHLAIIDAAHALADTGALDTAYSAARAELQRTLAALRTHSEPMTTGVFADRPVQRDHATGLPVGAHSNTTRDEFLNMVDRAKDYIRAGDIFQVVLGQRLEQRSTADPFDVYRALRVVNPSPYMVYLQTAGAILIASSPEILCRVRRDQSGERILTNRPLAGTRPRGDTAEHDAALEAELLADQKETAEHVMLVDLARNDVGKVCRTGSVSIDAALDVERYSHVMHISSTVTGTLRNDLDAWDALRSTLPVGTVSGAPKIRAMQIIDELEANTRGPYAGGFGYVSLDGQMDIALALRTIVTPTTLHEPDANRWTYHLQAGAGVVYDSDPTAEFTETVNKAAALSRAVTAAEEAFGNPNA
jgi:anthranilate synthase component 1